MTDWTPMPLWGRIYVGLLAIFELGWFAWAAWRLELFHRRRDP